MLHVQQVTYPSLYRLGCTAFYRETSQKVMPPVISGGRDGEDTGHGTPLQVLLYHSHTLTAAARRTQLQVNKHTNL